MTQTLKIAYIITILAGSGCFIACSNQDNKVTEKSAETTVYTDDMGTTVLVKNNPSRVIGLAPSITEFLFEICPDSQVVGRTQVCDYPEGVLDKPVVNSYPLDQEGLLKLQPDLVLALENINAPSEISRMRELGLTVFVLKTTNLDSVLAACDKIGSLTGNLENGNALKQRLLTSFQQYEQIPDREPSKQLKVLALASVTPIYVYGANTVFSEKLGLLGYQNAISDTFRSNYPEVNTEYLLKNAPDILIGGSYTHLDSTFFRVYPELKNIPAYQCACVYDIPAGLMSRPNPRIPVSLQALNDVFEDCLKKRKDYFSLRE